MTGARGISIMFASGDFGVGDGDPDPATQKCFANVGPNVTRFIPAFPASCVHLYPHINGDRFLTLRQMSIVNTSCL